MLYYVFNDDTTSYEENQTTTYLHICTFTHWLFTLTSMSYKHPVASDG
jgi:hypothetical protein